MAEKFAFTYEQKKRMAQQTAQILTEEIGLKGDAIDAVELIPDIEAGPSRRSRLLTASLLPEYYAALTASSSFTIRTLQ